MIDWPSGVHAGEPCRSSESDTTRAFVPSACITYKRVLPMLPDGECDRPSIRGDCRAPKDCALPDRSTIPCRFHWRASRCSRLCRSQKHTEDNLDRVAERIPCWLSERLDPPSTPLGTNQRFANARVFFSDSRAWQPAGDRQRWPPATCIDQAQRSADEECGARRPCYKAMAPSHRDRWRGTSASADPTGPDNSRVHCAT